MQKAKSYRNLILGCCMAGGAMLLAFFFLYHTYIQDIMPRNLPVPESQKILMILSVGGSAPAGVIQKELSTLLPVWMKGT